MSPRNSDLVSQYSTKIVFIVHTTLRELLGEPEHGSLYGGRDSIIKVRFVQVILKTPSIPKL